MNCRPVRATDCIPEMVQLVQTLLDKGYAYKSEGSVYFKVSAFPAYGQLTHVDFSGMRDCARVDSDKYDKENARDFVLWKAAKEGEPFWSTPFGPGRPGWHIECSAMSTALLGTHFDLHGGGMDLKFPHHENEIAQSCAATGDEFVNLWMHNGFVNVDDEKMSKSLGNFFTLREVLKTLRHAEVLRYFFLASHYRGPINYSLEQLEQADAALTRIYTALRGLPAGAAGTSAATARFYESMDDDFNTPEALAVLQGLTREVNTAKDAGDPARAAALAGELKTLGNVLGLLTVPAEEWFRLTRTAGGASAGAQLSDAQVEQRIAARAAARARKDFKESDRVRDELAASGVVLEDKPGGETSWRRA